MPFSAALVIGGTQLLGGYMQGQAAQDAARTSANAQLQSSQIAADAQKFRPVGVTSRFGSSNFGFDDNGYLSSAGYTPSSELLGYQDFLSGQGAQTQQDVSGLLSLGRGYLAEDPNAVKQRYIQQQRALLAPENEQALAGIRNNLFQQGRGGLATGATNEGGMAATNPEMAAYYNALAKQNAALTAGADQASQQQITFGQGLLSSAYSPLQTNVGLQGTFEQLAQSPLDIGAQLGGRAATAGANVGQSLLAGGLAAAKSNYAADAYSPWGSVISGAASNPQVQNALGQWNYAQPVQPGQYTPGSSTFNGPMYQQPNTGVSQWDTGSQGF
jgi:hypothetical protein